MSTQASEPTSGAPSDGTARRAVVIAGALAVGLLGSGALVWQSTNAAFTGSSSPGVNNWTAGSVSISTNGSGAALLSTSGLIPGSSATKCVTVTYGGSVASNVKLFAGNAAGTLNNYVNLVISQGTGSAIDCSDFVVSGGALFTGTATGMATSNASFANGLGNWAPTGAAQTRTYKFVYGLDAATPDNQQGQSGSLGFTWEAQTP